MPVELSSRAVVATEAVEAVFRSPAEPRLVVLDKQGGGKADALNVGLNYCRNRFVCGVDADMVFARDALSKAMGAFLSDPAQVVGLTSFVEIAENPASALRGGEYRIPDSRPFLLFQTLDYLRAFFNNRIAWSRLGFMLCAVGAFQVWRRELLDELGGWSRDYTCEDIELTFRVHRVLQERGLPYRVLCLPDRIGVTEGPDTIGKLVAQRERWQRVILETWWANRRMCFNRRYGRVGMLGMPFYLVSEIVAPAFELLAVATLAVGAALGLVDWWLFALVVGLISLVNSGFSAASLLMVERQSRRLSSDRSRATAGADARRDLRLSACPVLGADQGHLAIPAGRQGVAQVRAERPNGAGVTGRPDGRRWEEYLLLLVSAGAGAVAVVSAPEAVSPRPVLSAATALAFALSLATACVFWFAGAARRAAVQTRAGDEDTARRVLAALPDGLVLLDRDRVVSVNRAFCELVGYGRDELMGAEPPFPFWPPEHRHALERWQAKLSARGSAGRAADVPPSGREPGSGARRRELGRLACAAWASCPHRSRRVARLSA